MSGIDEQKLICLTCKKVPIFFRFRLKWEGRHYTIWHLNKMGMVEYGHNYPVIFDSALQPVSRWNEFIDMVTDVVCGDCGVVIESAMVVSKMVTMLRHVLEQKGGVRLGTYS